MLESMRGDDHHGPSDTHMMVFDNRDGPGAAPESSFPPVLTDAQGRFEIHGLPRSTYTVLAEAQRGQLRARASGVRPDELRALAVTALSGTVAAASGPSARFSVELDGPTRAQRGFTDGAFSFARVDPGSYTVRVQSSDGNGQATVEVKPDEAATVDIKLASNAIVIGTLVDTTGKPIAGQPVAIVPDSGDGRVQLQLEAPRRPPGRMASFGSSTAPARRSWWCFAPRVRSPGAGSCSSPARRSTSARSPSTRPLAPGRHSGRGIR
jgi:hypothetical protein